MKEKIFINARIIDPSQSMDEKGSLILNDKGKVKAIGKNVKKTDANKDAEIIDLKNNILIPGLVDMKAFVGELSGGLLGDSREKRVLDGVRDHFLWLEKIKI